MRRKESASDRWRRCEGRVCGEFVMCYPPGIPILAPGERDHAKISWTISTYAKEKGCSLTGPEDPCAASNCDLTLDA